MVSKKGIAITGMILAAITSASFLIWLIPQGSPTTFVVTDYEDYLDGAKNIHEILQESIELELGKLQDGDITPEDYIRVTEVTSSQVTTKISEFVTSKPPEEWQDSYIAFMDAMKKFNSYVAETKVLANMIENGNAESEIAEIKEKIKLLKTETEELVKISDRSRPP